MEAMASQLMNDFKQAFYASPSVAMYVPTSGASGACEGRNWFALLQRTCTDVRAKLATL